MATEQRGLAATLAFAAAVAAFFLSPVAGLLVAVGAVILGAFGFLRAASPRVSGARLSVLAIVLGLTAIVVKVLHGVLKIIF